MTRERILDAIRSVSLPEVSLPNYVGLGATYPDPVGQFKTALESVGGRWVKLQMVAELEDYLRTTYPDARNRFCGYPDATLQTVDPALASDPRELKDMDLAVVRGEFGVAENGAVWVEGARVPHRVTLFSAQHLVLLLDPREIVHNLHQAYQRLDLGETAYGLFISGPSKTADIEQCLVVGAHGPRSLTVLFVEWGPYSI